MRTKRITGVVILLIGVALIIIGIIGRYRMGEARHKASYLDKGPWGGSDVTNMVGGAIESKIGSYDQPIFWCFVGGIVLIIVGGVTLVRCSKGKRRSR